MPLIQREIKPWSKLVDTTTLVSSQDGQRLACSNTCQEDLSQVTMTGVLRQLAELSKLSAAIFENLKEESVKIDKSMKNLVEQYKRVEKLVADSEKTAEQESQTAIQSAEALTTPGQSASRSLESVVLAQQNLFTGGTRGSIQENYALCQQVPPLHLLDEYSRNGSSMKSFSNPELFFEEWLRSEEERLNNIEQEVKSFRMNSKKDKKQKSKSRSKYLPPRYLGGDGVPKRRFKKKQSRDDKESTCKQDPSPPPTVPIIAPQRPNITPTTSRNATQENNPAMQHLEHDTSSPQVEDSDSAVGSTDSSEQHEDVEEEKDCQEECQDSAHLDQYRKMLKIGLAEGAVRHKMIQNGDDPSLLFGQEQPSSTNKSSTTADVVGASTSCSSPSSSSSSFPSKEDPRLAKFEKMLQIGLASDAVRHAMIREGLDPSLLLKSEGVSLVRTEDTAKRPEQPANSGSSRVDPKLAKFDRMLKIGLGEEAVRHAMIREGMDPSLLFSSSAKAEDSDSTVGNGFLGDIRNNPDDHAPAGGNPLLAAIQQGKQLRKVNAATNSTAESNSAPPAAGNPLLAAIQQGKQLRKVDSGTNSTAESNSAPPVAGNPLLAAIQQGKQLRKVNAGTNSIAESNSAPPAAGNPLLAAIQQGKQLRQVHAPEPVATKSTRPDSMSDILSAIKNKGVMLRKVQQAPAEEKKKSTSDAQKLTGVAAILARRVELIAKERNDANDGIDSDEGSENSDWEDN